MTELLLQQAVVKELNSEEARLPQDLYKPWRQQRDRRIISVEEARAQARAAQSSPGLKKRLSIHDLAPASALILIYFVNRLLAAGAQLSDPCLCFRELVKRHMIVRLLAGPLEDLGGPTKVLLLRSVKTFSERVLREPTEGLDMAMLRTRANELARDYSGVLKPYQEYREAALALEPTMSPGEPHDLCSAIMAREKAVACLAVSIDPRLGEISGLSVEHVVLDGDDVIIVIPAEVSKERHSQSRALDVECAKPVAEYVCCARPFLSGQRRQGVLESSALWLTKTGGPLIQEGVNQALSKVLANAMGVPVGTKILRKVMASRDDVADAQIGSALGHALHSILGIDLYSARNIRKARRELVSLWDDFDTSGVSDS